ncbi:beta subunit of fatty acid synthetase [Entomophthora muscae]|uniref:Beta subunit of fatty acid synthetase n=1 Tax=Entomophthora muscae TaxID=34485 RepID=A0ACC2UHX3_9FUNG|nr:beta subunit of fatty acid synthetase [Entomophthora muscae]
MKGCNNHIKDFYYQLWFNSAEFNKLSIDTHHTLVAEAVTNKVKVYAENIQYTTIALIDVIIIVAWMIIIKDIFPKFIDGDPLKLVHLSKIFTMIKSASPMYSVNSASVVIGMMEADRQFLYSVIFTGLKTSFHNSSEMLMKITLPASKNTSLLYSMPYTHVYSNNATFKCDYEPNMIFYSEELPKIYQALVGPDINVAFEDFHTNWHVNKVLCDMHSCFLTASKIYDPKLPEFIVKAKVNIIMCLLFQDGQDILNLTYKTLTRLSHPSKWELLQQLYVKSSGRICCKIEALLYLFFSQWDLLIDTI